MIAMVSGGFDPLHIGHLDLIESAARYGDVIVALNSDEWLIRKKGYCFMPWAERSRVLMAMSLVTGVYAVDDEDGTVAQAMAALRPDYFVNGGDRRIPDPREEAICHNRGIVQIFAGGDKIQSSSKLVEAAR